MRQTQKQDEGQGGGANDLHIAYLSQQQLRSFNLPYQLGFSDLPDTPQSFESPTDADTASISGRYEYMYLYMHCREWKIMRLALVQMIFQTCIMHYIYIVYTSTPQPILSWMEHCAY